MDERNQQALSDYQVERCRDAWALLTKTEGLAVELVVDRARQPMSRTVFREADGKVYLGADVEPGDGVSAGSRMSNLACLAHELAHAHRFLLGFKRPADEPDMLLDEAEASLHASFYQDLGSIDRETLAEHARDRITLWLSMRVEKEKAP
jgi:hypothetical protein